MFGLNSEVISYVVVAVVVVVVVVCVVVLPGVSDMRATVILIIAHTSHHFFLNYSLHQLYSIN